MARSVALRRTPRRRFSRLMELGTYFAGLLLFGTVISASITAAFAIAGIWLTHLAGPVRAVAIALLATAALIGVHLLPAVLGVMTRGTVGVLAAAVLVASLLALRRARARNPEPAEPRPSDSRASQVLAAVAVGGLAIYLAAMLARFGSTPVTFIDTVTFHIPGVARWIQSNGIWQIDQFLPGQAQGYYPNNGNVVDLAAILPWHSDSLIRFVNLPFLALTWLALYAAGRELGAAAASAAIAAAAALSYPAVTSYVVDSPTPDAVMYATFAAGLLFLLRHVGGRNRSDLLLAGLGFGIAFGTRWYGVAAVAVVVGVWLVGRLIFERAAPPDPHGPRLDRGAHRSSPAASGCCATGSSRATRSFPCASTRSGSRSSTRPTIACASSSASRSAVTSATARSSPTSSFRR